MRSFKTLPLVPRTPTLVVSRRASRGQGGSGREDIFLCRVPFIARSGRVGQ